MAQGNVELLHRAYEAFNQRAIDAFLAFLDPDVEFISVLMQVEGGEPHHGYDGVRRWWGLIGEFSMDFTSEIEEARDLGKLTLARVRVKGHGIQSDTPIEQTYWQVTEWRDGKAVWWRFVSSEADALEAARLRGWSKA
jgi:ketosteroid isomerase-like protein